ncbi:MAG: metallophosphoesterase family protein [Bacteroidetes bacterium]|nr:metallophosphoesterase family protein [Bacteroidota bacterium]
MIIGLLSDTHSYLDPKIFDYFKNADELWHAGDIGDAQVISDLKNFKPLRAVYGNIDDKEMQAQFPEDLRFECEGFDIWMTHIGGAPPNYNPRVKKILKTKLPDIFVCGHSHILRVKKDPALNGMLYLNPGAAGNHGFHAIKTILRFELINREIKKMEVIELGKRGQLTNGQ